MVPNLFILGAARCGTTSIHGILRQHPDIHAPYMKEPTFFHWPMQFVTNPFAYFRMFSSERRYRIDASTTYLGSSETPLVLKALFPGARFIVSVRDPKKRAYSLFRMMRREGMEPISEFSTALKMEAERSTSMHFWRTNYFDVAHYLYSMSSHYDVQLLRYFEVFDRQQFHVVSLAELSSHPIATTESLLDFLQLDPRPAQNFNYEIKNQSERGPSFDQECDRIMEESFHGLTARTDQLVGRSLDWSL